MKIFAAALLTASAAFAERLPMQMDFDRCTLAAENRSAIIQGRVRLELMLTKGGAVYGAFVHSAQGIEDMSFLHCLANAAMLWELPAVPVDYERPYVVSFVHGGTEIDFSDTHYFHGDSFNVPGRTSAFMPDMNDPAPVAEPDVKLAQATLEVADKASDAQHGTAYLAVRDYDKALASFRAALDHDGTDAIALRGMAHTLAARGAELQQARDYATKLVAIAPDSVSGHEALMHVCLAAHDDECALAQFRAAKAAPDMQPRSRELAALQEGVRAAAMRLASATGQPNEDACAKLAGEEAQALCVVKRCLDEGSAEYAKELAAQNKSSVAPGEWTAQPVGGARYLVQRRIGDSTARWLVTVGDELTMKPASSEARQITLRHSRCAARTLGSR